MESFGLWVGPVSREHALQNMSHLLLGYNTKVVDTFADARQNDLQNLAEEMEDEIEHDRRALAKLFAKIDKDNSGQLLGARFFCTSTSL